MELFVDLAHKYNKTIILVTHSRETAAYADRIILLGDGIIESGASHGIA
jgi:ABC-type lipoprotein export system ATPase subunit